MMTFLEYIESQDGKAEDIHESPYTIIRDIIRAHRAKDIVKALNHGITPEHIASKLVDLPYNKKQRVRNDIRAYIRTEPSADIIKKLEQVWHASDDASLTGGSGKIKI